MLESTIKGPQGRLESKAAQTEYVHTSVSGTHNNVNSS